MQLQYSALGYRVDLYFHDHKIAIEIDENRHCDKNINYKMDAKKQ